jgi:cell division septation protein DedD
MPVIRQLFRKMPRTKASFVAVAVFFSLFFLSGVFVCAQDPNKQAANREQGNGLEVRTWDVEVKRLEKLASEANSAPDKRKSLTQLARLYQLSGDMALAAQAWQDAAFADKANRDDESLVQAALYFAAVGSFDRASANLRLVLLSGGQNGDLVLRARFLAAQIEAFRYGDIGPLAGLLGDSAYESRKPAICYTIFRISGENVYKNRLLSEWPSSPEALALRDGNAITPFPSALWSLLPKPAASLQQGAFDIPSTAQQPQAHPGQAASKPTQQATAPTLSVQQPITQSGQTMLQAGLFSGEVNAQNLAQSLQTAGFDAKTSKRAVNGKTYWAVLVSAGANTNATLSRLKAKGFEAFPVKQ